MHVAVLWTFAIAFPLFQLFDNSPDYLVAQDNGWPDLPLVAAALVLVPPTAVTVAEACLGRWPPAGRVLRQVVLGGLFAALVLQVLKGEFDPGRRSLVLIAILAGVFFGFLYARGRFVPTLLSVLAPLPLVALVWFLGFSRVSEIAFGADDGQEVGRTQVSVPVVLVIFDELSAASLGEGGEIDNRLGAFRRIARTSTWFPNATTVADNTTRAVPAILTGRMPAKDALPIASELPPSIFDRVSGPFNVEEPITDLCGRGCDDGAWTTHARELISSMVDLTKRRLRRGDLPDRVGLPQDALDTRAEDFESWSAGIVDGLNVLHIELPHNPYQYAGHGRYSESLVTPGLTGETWTTDSAVVEQGESRYLAQLDFTDRLLGQLIDRLERRGIWDRALVIVTADHGVAFVPGKSRRNVAVETFGEIAGVPLFVKAPGQTRPELSRAAVRTTDVLPTVGDHLGANWRLPGQSLRTPRSRRETVVSAQFGPPVRMPPAFYERLRRKAAERLAQAEPFSRLEGGAGE
ncbi:MAG: sulfatase-like hydrolase/transferase [Thermoleophilaceae bacterium]|nr:sulfatase-like hydrolase/transferase [Thermoleophilaceae bacterium]